MENQIVLESELYKDLDFTEQFNKNMNKNSIFNLREILKINQGLENI